MTAIADLHESSPEPASRTEHIDVLIVGAGISGPGAARGASSDHRQSAGDAASDDTIEMFLQTRSGSCEQFASTFAVMARTLGIPSRVATVKAADAPTAFGVPGEVGQAAR